MSNIRWGSDAWMKVSPTHFTKVLHNPARFFPTSVDIVIKRKGEWEMYINRNYIATFNSWEEAEGAAPMLFKLHGDT